MNKLKNKKGITLIALVITIIVLLILAGVSIAMLTGENGILTKASSAKEKNAQKTVEEQVKLAVLASKTNVNAQINTAELETELAKYEITEITKGENGNLPWTVKKDGNEYTIEEEGVKEIAYVTAEQIAENPRNYYGKKVVNYKGSESDTSTYRIFYVDKDNYFEDGEYTIYLKSDANKKYTKGSTSYLENTKVKVMNKIWANERETATWNDNEKIAAYLCSPVNSDNYTETVNLPWNECCNSNETKLNYVIGGPSVEMYVKSYNQTHDGKNGKDVLGAFYQTSNAPGYGFEVNGEKFNENGWVNDLHVLDDTKYNKMYGVNTNKSWLLASPSSDWETHLPHQTGGQLRIVDCMVYDHDLAPLVSLQSDFELKIEL